VTSGPCEGWSPVFDMEMRSLFSNGLSEKVRMGLSSTDIMAATSATIGAGEIGVRDSVTGVCVRFFSVFREIDFQWERA